MHSIIRQGQFHGQLHGQFKGQLKAHRSQPLPHAAQAVRAHAIAYAGPQLDGSEWQRRSLVRREPNPGRIDVCRLIVATLGLALYLALPIAAVSFALNLLFG